MRYLLISILLSIVGFAQTKYGYGNIDMHGGKKESLIQKKNSHFSNKNRGLASTIDKNKKKIKKEKKVKIINDEAK